MSDSRKHLSGDYLFEEGKFIPQGDMELINLELKKLKMLAGSTETGEGEFYYNPITKEYWLYRQYENYHTELTQVERSYIEANYPMVDCDSPLDIK